MNKCVGDCRSCLSTSGCVMAIDECSPMCAADASCWSAKWFDNSIEKACTAFDDNQVNKVRCKK